MIKFQFPFYQEEISEFRYPGIQDNMFHSTGFPLGASYPSAYMKYQPVGDKADEGECLLGRDGCAPLCSGYTKNRCNLVAPIPGPQWQVQTAATVQKNLTEQKYTPSVCPLGPSVLRSAPNCKNSNDNDRESYRVTCNASQPVPKFK